MRHDAIPAVLRIPPGMPTIPAVISNASRCNSSGDAIMARSARWSRDLKCVTMQFQPLSQAQRGASGCDLKCVTMQFQLADHERHQTRLQRRDLKCVTMQFQRARPGANGRILSMSRDLKCVTMQFQRSDRTPPQHTNRRGRDLKCVTMQFQPRRPHVHACWIQVVISNASRCNSSPPRRRVE